VKLRNCIISLVYMCAVMTCFQARADGGPEFVFEAGTSNKSIQFSTIDGGTGNPVNYSAKIVTLDYAGTVLYRNFYTRLKLSQSIKDDVVYDTVKGDVLFMSRSDLDLTLGYYIGGGVSAFIGHKRGEFEANVAVDVSSPDKNVRAGFIDSGIFAGMSYSVPLEESTVSLNFAYAKLDGEIDIAFPGATASTSGDTTGFSYSASWSKPITDSTSFTVALNVIRYELDDTALLLGTVMDTKQDFDAISVALVHYF